MKTTDLQPLRDLIAEHDEAGNKADAGCLRIAMIEIDQRDKTIEQLLSACKEALDRFRSDGWPLNEANNAAIAQLQSAIAAAEGRDS
jgi:hypothetical protein